ncbi:MAG TPA: hypothetical protein VK619_14900 [Pyrinomonadaceae bacterium]|nr:hypothetical protein [Pyrinomonadaceae bacterium]
MDSSLSKSVTIPHLSRLARYLVIKSIADVIIVGVFAVGFYYSAFNPHFRGWFDEAGQQGMRGWAIDRSQPDERVEVQLYVDDHFVESRAADYPRPDLVLAGKSNDERHGFSFNAPTLAAGEHEARVYAVHASGQGTRRALQMIGEPIKFNVER